MYPIPIYLLEIVYGKLKNRRKNQTFMTKTFQNILFIVRLGATQSLTYLVFFCEINLF